jgi:hypothetical protein
VAQLSREAESRVPQTRQLTQRRIWPLAARTRSEPVRGSFKRQPLRREIRQPPWGIGGDSGAAVFLRGLAMTPVSLLL